MTHLTLLTFILSLSLQTASGSLSLTIEISGLRNNNGQVLLELTDEHENKVKGVVLDIKEKRCRIVIQNLKAGKYAFRYFHDENSNGKPDMNRIGIPKEGFGYSNNASGTFGPPSFKKTVFELKQSMKMQCRPTYYLD